MKNKFFKLSLWIFALNVIIILGALSLVHGNVLEFRFQGDETIGNGFMLTKYLWLPILVIIQLVLFFSYTKGNPDHEISEKNSMILNLGLQSVLPWFAIISIPGSYLNITGVVIAIVAMFIYLIVSMSIIARILKK